jgi:hypothetical protein
MVCGEADSRRQAIEDARDPEGRQRAVDLDGDALAREVVHDVQRPEIPTVGGRVGREVHRRALEPLTDGRQRDALRARQPLASPAPDLQARRLVDPVHALVIDRQAVALKAGCAAADTPKRARTAACTCSRSSTATLVALVRR